MTIAEQIYTLVKTLLQDEANEVLTFVAFIKSRHENGGQPTAPEEPEVPWTELVRSLAGAWADDFPDLETIRAGMGQDILRESL